MNIAVHIENKNTEPFFGDILDADGHCYVPPEVFREITGEIGGGPMLDFLDKYVGSEEDVANRAKNRDELHNIKGISALGAADAVERIEALDSMGMKAQIVFPNTFGIELRINSPEARAACERYNDYILSWQKTAGTRARPACELNMGDVDWACKEATRIIAAGATHITLSCAEPPAGVSPANEVWDRLWRIFEESDTVATLHLGAGGLMAGRDPDPMFPVRAWGDAKGLKGKPLERPGGEEAISPYFMLVTHYAPELFLQTMVMGGVFERVPRLRFGIIEFGAAWVGPAVERMDLWVEFMAKIGNHYTMKPSEYVRRNVRVTPFWHENLPNMIERYGMPEIYCFSTDYPHLEGSRDPIGKFRKQLKSLPDAYAKDFFIENARWLFPNI